jgi:putative endonuclease
VSTEVGNLAEDVAAKYLASLGYKVLDRNWRRRQCEIDITASKNAIIYFVEVKYRRNENQGGGLEYITPKKLNQMRFAAKIWVSENKYEGDYELSAIEVSGDFKITSFLPNLD